MQNVDGIPLLGISRWPLDFFWNRMIKRLEDIAGSLVGLLLAAPVIAIAATVIKVTSPGPVFYSQERCGEKGRVFRLVKLRTMKVDAENETGPVGTGGTGGHRGSVLKMIVEACAAVVLRAAEVDCFPVCRTSMD